MEDGGGRQEIVHLSVLGEMLKNAKKTKDRENVLTIK